MEQKGQLYTPATLASGKIPRYTVKWGRGGGGGCCCLDPETALDAVKETSITPVKNRTP